MTLIERAQKLIEAREKYEKHISGDESTDYSMFADKAAFEYHSLKHAADIAKRMIELENENAEIKRRGQEWIEKCYEARAENEILKSKASQFESTLKETMRVRDELEAKNEKLRVALKFCRDYRSQNEGFAGPSIELNEIRIAAHESLAETESK